MTAVARNARALVALAAVAVVWLVAAAMLSVTHHAPAISVAAAFDFCATAGLAIYLIAVRRGVLPRWTLGATLAIGAALARHALAATPNAGAAVVAAGATLELAALTWLAIRGRLARRAWRAARADGAARYDALVAAFDAARFPPRVAHAIATELALLGLVVTGWRAPVTSPALFTVHRNTGWSLYAGVFVFLIAVETVVVHVVLAAYASPTIAVVVTVASAYSVLWFIGDALALRHGGITVGPDALELRIGMRWRGRIARTAIAAVRPAIGDEPGAVRACVLTPNLVLELHAPVTLTGLLGMRRTGRAIALSIDDRDGFCARLAAHP